MPGLEIPLFFSFPLNQSSVWSRRILLVIVAAYPHSCNANANTMRLFAAKFVVHFFSAMTLL